MKLSAKTIWFTIKKKHSHVDKDEVFAFLFWQFERKKNNFFFKFIRVLLIRTEGTFRNALTAIKINGKNKQIKIIKIVTSFAKEFFFRRKSCASISKLCFRQTKTNSHNNIIEDDNLKNNNSDKRWPQISYTDSNCPPRSRAIHYYRGSEGRILTSRSTFEKSSDFILRIKEAKISITQPNCVFWEIKVDSATRTVPLFFFCSFFSFDCKETV